MNNKIPVFVGALFLVVIAASTFVVGLSVGKKSDLQPGTPAPTLADAKPLPPVTIVPGPGDQQIDAIRRGAPIDQEIPPPAMAKVENTDVKRNRAYPMQPPTIPHSIDNYQVDLNSNRCLLCHARANADKFQAPPVSVTHYMDRDDQFLATISPRRYFCNQCHVVQTDAKPLVANTFKDIDTVLSNEREKAN
ncbi:MAG TPA: nitrate reductase cytochrome c-type subunit [Luteibacter sp.]|jgi:cytochrome c-type protein NapB|uniref:nitrate reductase cytochrome c-type subunit n=1 Tax=Luteibacter sp. TaxID=1886636 RepID=UPI002F4058EC